MAQLDRAPDYGSGVRSSNLLERARRIPSPEKGCFLGGLFFSAH